MGDPLDDAASYRTVGDHYKGHPKENIAERYKENIIQNLVKAFLSSNLSKQNYENWLLYPSIKLLRFHNFKVRIPTALGLQY